jgi:hypothetical protein
MVAKTGLYDFQNRAQWTKEGEDGKKKRVGKKATSVAKVAAKHWKTVSSAPYFSPSPW